MARFIEVIQTQEDGGKVPRVLNELHIVSASGTSETTTFKMSDGEAVLCEGNYFGELRANSDEKSERDIHSSE